jgi:hypothetical protein
LSLVGMSARRSEPALSCVPEAADSSSMRRALVPPEVPVVDPLALVLFELVLPTFVEFEPDVFWVWVLLEVFEAPLDGVFDEQAAIQAIPVAPRMPRAKEIGFVDMSGLPFTVVSQKFESTSCARRL